MKLLLTTPLIPMLATGCIAINLRSDINFPITDDEAEVMSHITLKNSDMLSLRTSLHTIREWNIHGGEIIAAMVFKLDNNKHKQIITLLKEFTASNNIWLTEEEE